MVALSFWLWVKDLMEPRDELTSVEGVITRAPTEITDERFALLL